MKKIQKTALAILVLISIALTSKAQIEIVIVGSSHNNLQSTQNFQAVIDKLKNFKPDMVFGEYIPAEDYAKLDDNNWAKKGFRTKVNYIQELNPESAKNASTLIRKNQKALLSSPNYHQTRMHLAVEYAKTWDRGNFDYQVYVLDNYMKPHFGNEEKAAYNKMFGGTDSLKKLNVLRPGSEYNKIFFPLIYQLGQNQIYNMDCQTFDEPWSVAWGKTDSLFKILSAKAKADTLSAEAKTLKAIEQYSSYADEEEKKFKDDEYAGMNTDKYAELNDAWNFYGGKKFFGYAGFPTETVKEMIAQWTLRNEGMCKNVIEQAKAKKATRVVVGVGAAHRKIMEEILSKNPDIKIVSYNDLK
ncbi:DUF5694 domain-containing protein [Pedobacter agri]|uniref:DUF5694 domain-containing protein n=1 Tax=Pedobacter agri TaxID=454586 RepID=UPI00292EA695|nr:DUF5694 domain-containing protein [Pedobacter agri]